MKFKLLALRLNSPFALQKNLKPHVLYKLTSEVQFNDANEQPLSEIDHFRKIHSVKDHQSYPSDLFSIGEADEKINIHISAILGRNGSGKSSLLELLYLLIFCLSERRRLITQRVVLKAKVDQGLATEYEEEFLDSINELIASADIELYYQVGHDYYVLRNTTRTSQYKLTEKGWKVSKFDSLNFFYTISVNYSQYGLNATGNYFWLKSLFHKNDGYRTPIVLNPYRDEGNIDINSEIHLAQTRILTNLTSGRLSSENLINDKTVSSICFMAQPGKLGLVEGFRIQDIYVANKMEHGIDLLDFFLRLMAYFGRKRFKQDEPALTSYLKNFLEGNTELIEDRFERSQLTAFRPERINELLCVYIICKVMKICNKYSGFRQHCTQHFKEGKFEFWIIKDLTGYARDLFDDSSHITLKLKQSINMLLNGYMNDQEWKIKQDLIFTEHVTYTTQMPFAQVQKIAFNAFKDSTIPKKDLAQFIPTAFFRITILLTEGKTEFPFSQLSSGEQQLLHSVHSILYHLLNLDSRSDQKEKYNKVNLVLDEIELYYHPKYQKDFINFLLENIKNINLGFIRGINMIFSTHSPFILSDIPHSSVLKLDRGAPVIPQKDERTFGANIHDMLADSFFLDLGLIGTFAEKQINKCILEMERLRHLKKIEELSSKPDKTAEEDLLLTELTSKNALVSNALEKANFTNSKEVERKDQSIYKLIQLIGEPIIRFKLLEMYDELFLGNGNEKERTRRLILSLMEQNDIDKEDL